MAYLPKPKECINRCGAMIYFDSNNPVSHPSSEKWIPLTYIEDTGVYTGEVHDCPKRTRYGNGSSSGQQQQQVPASLDSISSKLDRIISLLETKK